MARWKNRREEKDPRYFWFAVADVLKQLAVYVEEANFSDKDLAIQYTKQVVELLTEIARETVKAYYDERVWVPVYDLLMEFVAKDPYDDTFSEFVELKGLRDRLEELVKVARAKAKEVKRKMEELERQEREFSKRRDWEDWDNLPF
jgi:hypothetical protein